MRGVEAGSPGEKAGIEPGDIITKFDGKAIEKPSDLPRLVGNTKPGTKSSVTVFRRGSSRDLNVTDRGDRARQAHQARGRARRACSQAAGIGRRQVAWGSRSATSPRRRRRNSSSRAACKIDAATDAAARAGLREGDVVLAVNNVEVANVKEFEAALVKADKTKPVSVLFRRGDWAQYALIRPSR